MPLSVIAGRERVTLTLRGRNLTDAFYGEYSGYPTTNVYLGAPRSVEFPAGTLLIDAARPHLIRRLHLWLGLSVGAMFVVLGLTGSALVFYEAIDALLHPEIGQAADGPAPGWDSHVWGQALATVRRSGRSEPGHGA